MNDWNIKYTCKDESDFIIMLCKVSCIYQQHVPILQHFLVVVEFQTSSIRLPRIRKLNFARNTKKIPLYTLRSVCIFSIHFLEC